MIATVTIDTCTLRFDCRNALDISIPIRFGGPQPSVFGTQDAVSEAVKVGRLVGDTRSGGSCNFEKVTIVPLCNGTHTEGIGHILHDRVSVRESLRDAFALAALISVAPSPASVSEDSYPIRLHESESLITRRLLATAMSQALSDQLEFKPVPRALIVRTLPNEETKMERNYDAAPPPFFSSEAMDWVAANGFEHLLVDLPSIDRLDDQGRLSNHRRFWNVEPGSFAAHEKSRLNATITELVYVPDEVRDGLYLLNLQISPFQSDASPSRPILFPIL